MKKYLLLCVFALTMILAATAQAAITSTRVDAGMEILYGSAGNTDIALTASGARSATLVGIGMNTGASVYSDLNISALTAQSATLDFQIGYNSNGYTGQGYLGQIEANSNVATINYSGSGLTTVTVTWNFHYTDNSSSGLQPPAITDTQGTYWHIWRINPTDNSYTGQLTFTLTGNDTIYINFQPSISGSLGAYDITDLSGSISLSFQPAAVPLPGALLLFGPGLAALGLLRRRLAG